MAKTVCTILARGGSKGVPGKNLRWISGKSLIKHTVDQALELFDCVAVSSDSEAILSAASGAHHLIQRPAELASDSAGKCPAIAHCVLAVEARLATRFEVIVDLSVTSPLRSVNDIRGALALYQSGSNVITGTPARHSPYFSLVEQRGEFVALSKPSDILRRQDSPACFDMNGAVYVWNRDRFIQDPRVLYPDTRLYEMPVERSIDIDTEFDLQWAQFYFHAGTQQAAPAESIMRTQEF
jgi:CMP-N,N'-diacetyllegionaminic acid synthase